MFLVGDTLLLCGNSSRVAFLWLQKFDNFSNLGIMRQIILGGGSFLLFFGISSKL